MSKEGDIRLLIQSGTPLVVIETHEEKRAVELFRRVLSDVLRPMYRWSATTGMRRIDLDVASFGADECKEPEVLLQKMAHATEPSIFLLLDFHPYLADPLNIRKLREIVLRQNGLEHTVVLISPRLKLPTELQYHAAQIELSMPDEKTLDQLVKEEAFRWSRENDGRRVKVNKKSLDTLVKNLQGLALEDARKLARKVIYNDGAITDSDIEKVMQQKFKLLNRGGVLSYEFELVEFDDIAGLTHLKKWLLDRRKVMHGHGGDLKLDPPKGVLLLGVQGCGKSLAAKAVAAGFGMPLLRLDFGSLYNKYHGETERNLRESLSSAEIMAPCVLWIDEIEKGISVTDSDSGTSKRILGTLLTWMAEREQPVFLVATANDIEALPPELVRKGRFDEIFFVDLPKPPVRERIFAIHLGKRGLDVEDFDLAALGEASEGFSGAEIEQAVVSALYSALAEDVPVAQEAVLEAITSTRPLSVVMAERIAALRHWASSRTVPAD
ncbi:MAG: AAA family ATPase [Pseudomonadota bacterium]